MGFILFTRGTRRRSASCHGLCKYRYTVLHICVFSFASQVIYALLVKFPSNFVCVQFAGRCFVLVAIFSGNKYWINVTTDDIY